MIKILKEIVYTLNYYDPTLYFDIPLDNFKFQNSYKIFREEPVQFRVWNIQKGSIGFVDDHSLVEDKQGKRFELCVAF